MSNDKKFPKIDLLKDYSFEQLLAQGLDENKIIYAEGVYRSMGKRTIWMYDSISEKQIGDVAKALILSEPFVADVKNTIMLKRSGKLLEMAMERDNEDIHDTPDIGISMKEIMKTMTKICTYYPPNIDYSILFKARDYIEQNF